MALMLAAQPTTQYTRVCTENITGEGGERAAMDRIVEEGEAMEDLYNKHSSSSLKIVLQQPQRQPQQRRFLEKNFEISPGTE